MSRRGYVSRWPRQRRALHGSSPRAPRVRSARLPVARPAPCRRVRRRRASVLAESRSVRVDHRSRVSRRDREEREGVTRVVLRRVARRSSASGRERGQQHGARRLARSGKSSLPASDPVRAAGATLRSSWMTAAVTRPCRRAARARRGRRARVAGGQASTQSGELSRRP